ncbi:SGNH/GDSL hydrolase family protein [Granulicella sp. dw_53]|uniref:SGNH/GDSL hydrolase family protein n=1 Tax=Granulicella sp. dw_53 TaxID=2719792 RepID=UPI001BD4A493|nr:SGNH/GDSL hydrolase family protein [Granulicella sp. dw_53]
MRLTTLYKLLLGPVLLAQGRRLRRTALRLKEAEGERSGIVTIEGSQSPLKLLFVGDSTMAGVGARHQSAALAPQVAANLAERLGRSIHWQMVAKSGVNTKQALELVRAHQIPTADVLITALGTNDVTSQTAPLKFIADYKNLVDAVAKQTGARFGAISGLPPLHIASAAPQPLRWYLGRYAHLLDEHLRRWTALQQNLTYVSLQWASNPKDMAEDGFHPGENLYKAWANLLAENIATLLSKRASTDATNSLG